MNAMFSGQDCFLAKRAWQKSLSHTFDAHIVLNQDSLLVDQIIPREAVFLMEDYFENLAKLPRILRYGYELREAKRHGMPIDEAKVVLLLKHTNATRAGVLHWYQEFEKWADSPVEAPSQDCTSIYPTVLSYTNPWLGSLYMGYWATMLILQEILNHCQSKVDYTDNNRQCANNIYRSLENVGAGVMGPFRVGYALRIAYDFADLDTQYWIRGLLSHFEKTYAATSPDTYPAPGRNENGFR